MLGRLYTQLLRSSRLKSSPALSHPFVGCQYSDGPKKEPITFDIHEVMTNVTDRENSEGQEFLDNMDEMISRKKQRVENEIEKMKGLYLVPDRPLTPHNWKILLTECTSESKRQRYLQFLAKKDFQRANDKIPRPRTVPEIEGARILDEFTYPMQKRDKTFRSYNCYSMLMFGSPIIFDCDLEMSYREQINSESQLLHCYGENIRHRYPFHIHYTGYKNTRFEKSVESMQFKKTMYASFHEGSFMDLFKAEDLIYLTPDGPPLNKYYPNKIYIIGSSVDLNPKPRMTLGKAKSLGIQVGRFPLEENVKLYGNRSLTLINVINIMLNVNISHNWRDAILKSLPPSQFEALTEAQRHKRTKRHGGLINYKNTKQPL